MAESPGNGPHIHSGRQEPSGYIVPEVVEPDPGDASPAAEGAERSGRRIGTPGDASVGDIAEHKRSRVEGTARRIGDFGSSGPVLAETVDGRCIQGDSAALVGLGPLLDQLS